MSKQEGESVAFDPLDVGHLKSFVHSEEGEDGWEATLIAAAILELAKQAQDIEVRLLRIEHHLMNLRDQL